MPARPTPFPARRRPFPRVFSACSRRQLRAFFRKGGGACLSNAPDSGILVPRARCGNGLVEDGEECDCGSSQECPDDCCFAHNCSLRAGAQCTHGDCCARCLVRAWEARGEGLGGACEPACWSWLIGALGSPGPCRLYRAAACLALQPLCRALRLDLTICCPSVPWPTSLHLVTCVAEAGRRAVPPSCG